MPAVVRSRSLAYAIGSTEDVMATSEAHAIRFALHPSEATGGARAVLQEDAGSVSLMFLVRTSMVRPSSSVGLNSTTSVPA